MVENILHRRDKTVVRRLRLAPGEATPWHRDPFHRVSIVLSGDALAIEYRDGRKRDDVRICPGQTDWDEPTTFVHRALNVGKQLYEEVTIFFLDHPDAVPQPRDEP